MVGNGVGKEARRPHRDLVKCWIGVKVDGKSLDSGGLGVT